MRLRTFARRYPITSVVEAGEGGEGEEEEDDDDDDDDEEVDGRTVRKKKVECKSMKK